MNLRKRIYYKVLSYFDLNILGYRGIRLSREIKIFFGFKEHNPPQSIVNQLQDMGVDSTSHLKSNLLKHFQGTYRLLKKWGNSESVCLAGLCHALYGTETFSPALIPLESRPEISLLIGDEAEKLVYYYSITTRKLFFNNLNSTDSNYSLTSRLDGSIIIITELEFRQLLEIFLADRLEQILSLNLPYRYQYQDYFEKAKNHLSPEGFKEFSIANNL